MKDLLIGTLTRLGGPGICYVRTDGEHLTQLWTDGTLTDPNWQDVSPDGRIFSVSCDGPEPMDGCIHELTITPEGMKVLSTRSTGGKEPCHLTFSEDGRFLLCANYGTGSLAVFPISPNGIDERLQLIHHSGHGPHSTRRQALTCIRSPGFQRFPDASALLIWDWTGCLSMNRMKRGCFTSGIALAVPAGQGPRHMAYHPVNGDAFLITELGNRVYPVKFGRNSGQMLSDGLLTPEKADGVNYAAALWFPSNGDSLYASNRGEGSIVCLEVSPLRKAQTFFLPASCPEIFARWGMKCWSLPVRIRDSICCGKEKFLIFCPVPVPFVLWNCRNVLKLALKGCFSFVLFMVIACHRTEIYAIMNAVELLKFVFPIPQQV